MSWILNIDTSGEEAGIYLSREGKLMAQAFNNNQYDHAGWLHTAIQQLTSESNISLSNLTAVAVTEGPGSYTGLRVGMASAKGLCYALGIPLILVGTLKLMAASALQMEETTRPDILLCPLIDARRMEVFTAIYSAKLDEILAPQAMLLSETSFNDIPGGLTPWFFGSGAEKWKAICQHPNAVFDPVKINGNAFSQLTHYSFLRNEFATLAYSEPAYIKDIYIHPKK